MKKLFILVFSIASLVSVSAGQQEVSMSELALVTRMMEEEKGAATETKKESTEKTRMQKLVQSKVAWTLSGIVGVGAAIGALCYWNMPKEEKKSLEESYEEETSEFEVGDDSGSELVDSEIDPAINISIEQSLFQNKSENQNLSDEKSDVQNTAKMKSGRGFFGGTESTLTSVAKNVGRVCLIVGVGVAAVFAGKSVFKL